MRTIPHKVIGIHIRTFLLKGALARLEHNLIVAALVCIGHTRAKLIATDIIPILRAKIEVDRCAVVLIATNTHNLLTCRQSPMTIGGGIGKVNPIGSIEECSIGMSLVQTLTIRV